MRKEDRQLTSHHHNKILVIVVSVSLVGCPEGGGRPAALIASRWWAQPAAGRFAVICATHVICFALFVLRTLVGCALLGLRR
jgi:hypothetical protein